MSIPTTSIRFFGSILQENICRTMSRYNVVRLDGQSTYETWAATMLAVWRSMGLYEIGVDGVWPDQDATKDEVKAFESLSHRAVGVYIQVVTPMVLRNIIEMANPHLMWNHSKAEYQRTMAFALVYQLGNLGELPHKFDSTQPMSSFVQSFETEWSRLHKLARDSSDSFRQVFALFLRHDKAKRGFLLGFLKVKQPLFDIDYDTPQHSALATRSSGVKKPAKLTKAAHVSKSQPKDCTFCRKHHPIVAAGYYWTECQHLKQFKKDEARGKAPTEYARMTLRAEENVSKTLLYFDSTAYTCPYPERFEFIDSCSGLVKTSSGGNMEVVRRDYFLLSPQRCTICS
ncbi:hypothetical protein K3495_g500 [Podosphaera aphanis]|nr:hypothetical protein K3495_g500 [Podosphaera aphanis]